MCHLIFLAPVLALPAFWLFPLSTALPIYGGVVSLTALVLWPAAKALRSRPRTGEAGMVGIQGEALTDLEPHGLIRCQGEIWSAIAESPVPAGERVKVLAVTRLQVRVARSGPAANPAGG